ncbi:MAG TPA: hypothetical protein VMB18_09285 [Terriglobales bacterium]|jgi:hypothetical protein|nr:hypothetical protein [Terriglobales bacterium]
MPKKATAADAEVILKLYDLRRESEMRKARNWFGVEFWPGSADDFINLAMDMGSQQSAWLRQVSGYWNMAATLALSGAVNAELFLEPNASGEMYFVFAKVKPFLKELRQKMNSPDMFAPVEKIINSSKKSREFLKSMEARIAERSKMMMKVAKAS